MTDTVCPAPIEFADVVDYWAGDLTRADEDRIEEHVFTCARCARELAAAEALARGIAAVAREGRLHTVVTDAILNRLSADGVRDPDVHARGRRDRSVCRVGRRRPGGGADPGRLRGRGVGHHRDAPGIRRGDQRLSDVAVRPGQREILNALSAAHLRKLPATRVQVTVTAQIDSGERTIAEYTLDHGGTFNRLAGPL